MLTLVNHNAKQGAVSSVEEQNMVLYAIRYCLGRSSYAVSDGAKWALRYGKVHKGLRALLCRDIAERLRSADVLFDSDAKIWRRTLQELSDWTLRENNARPWETVDTCPENVYVETKREGEEGTMVCCLRILRPTQGGDWEDECEWMEKYEGITTVTHSTFAPPTHWRHLDNPCASIVLPLRVVES